jgi:hypothetical protein
MASAADRGNLEDIDIGRSAVQSVEHSDDKAADAIQPHR